MDSEIQMFKSYKWNYFLKVFCEEGWSSAPTEVKTRSDHSTYWLNKHVIFLLSCKNKIEIP